MHSCLKVGRLELAGSCRSALCTEGTEADNRLLRSRPSLDPLRTYGNEEEYAMRKGLIGAVTAETMIPEPFRNGPRYSGVLAAAGFAALMLFGELVR